MFKRLIGLSLSATLFSGVVAFILLVIHPVFLGVTTEFLVIDIPGFTESQRLTVIIISSVSIVVLISYIGYLLAAGKTRIEAAVRLRTRELATDRGRLLKLYDQSPVPYMTLLPDGTIHNPNIATLRLYGATSEALEGRMFFEMSSEEDKEHANDLFARFHSGVPIDREEIRIVRKDGAIRWVMLSVFLFHVRGKRKPHGLATLVDITDQKELDRAKTEFVSLAGHQLRTPLSTVKWYTEVLLSNKYGDLNGKQREYIQKVRGGNQIMVDLVDLLLNVSRIEMGTLLIDMKDVDMKVLIDDVLEELAPKIEEKRIIVDTTHVDSEEHIESDPRLLRIVIQNLLSNAVKYTPDEGSVRVSFKKLGGKHTLVVADTGYGIPAEQQDKIFTKMFRADNVRKKDVEGNGLGLYLVKSIVEKLGGSISFTSVVDEGTTFTVQLP